MTQNSPTELNEGIVLVNPIALGLDEVQAAVDLAKRSGAKSFLMGHTPDDKPEWHVRVKYTGHPDQFVSGHDSPQGAGIGIAEFLLVGSRCACGNTVTFLTDACGEVCCWRRVGQIWLAGCADGIDTHPGDVRFDPFPVRPPAPEL
jgi:hypothetical protein